MVRDAALRSAFMSLFASLCVMLRVTIACLVPGSILYHHALRSARSPTMATVSSAALPRRAYRPLLARRLAASAAAPNAPAAAPPLRSVARMASLRRIFLAAR